MQPVTPPTKKQARNRLPQPLAERLVAEFITHNPRSVLAGCVPVNRKSVADIHCVRAASDRPQ